MAEPRLLAVSLAEARLSRSFQAGSCAHHKHGASTKEDSTSLRMQIKLGLIFWERADCVTNLVLRSPYCAWSSVSWAVKNTIGVAFASLIDSDGSANDYMRGSGESESVTEGVLQKHRLYIGGCLSASSCNVELVILPSGPVDVNKKSNLGIGPLENLEPFSKIYRKFHHNTLVELGSSLLFLNVFALLTNQFLLSNSVHPHYVGCIVETVTHSR